MFLLMDHFKEELGSEFELTEPVRTFLKEYAWPGNIRELRNVVEYFIYTGHRQITMEDLPPTVLRSGRLKLRPVLASGKARRAGGAGDGKTPWAGFEDDDPFGSDTDSSSDSKAYSKPYSDTFWFVLGQLYEASEEGICLGREKLLAKARECYLPMSQQEVRNILTEMAEKGLARVSRGRGGSRLTLQGRQLWENRQKP